MYQSLKHVEALPPLTVPSQLQAPVLDHSHTSTFSLSVKPKGLSYTTSCKNGKINDYRGQSSTKSRGAVSLYNSTKWETKTQFSSTAAACVFKCSNPLKLDEHWGRHQPFSKEVMPHFNLY